MPVLSESEHPSSEWIKNPDMYRLPDYANAEERKVGNDPTNFEFYFDGTLMSHSWHPTGTFPGGDLSWNGQNPITIAATPIGYPSIHEFEGDLKEVRVYSRRLSSTEVSDMYNSGCGAAPTTQGLLLWVPLDEHSTLTNIQDYSSYGATGTTTCWGGSNFHTWEWQLNDPACVVSGNAFCEQLITMEGESTYRYAFNGMERDDELYGEGNAYTAMFWEYDTRLGRRWNVDPVIKPWESSYATFLGNPIRVIDPNEDDGYVDEDGNYLGDDGDQKSHRC